ncbi:MAG: FtsX-like permease family protein, partial [Caldilinea sp.]|nr:FtsX-like permease family protein [Caldilinea sp.]MDW8442676.1 FtsX-like permease family protein [Caldilineaceae bacterium]
ASIGILNLQLMAVFERTREMGVLAALGMKGRQIMALFLVEGTLIGVVGAVVGCLAGVGVVMLIRLAGGIDFSFAAGMGEVTALMGDHLIPSLTMLDVVGRGIIVAAIAALASLYPAWQAARKEPTEALRHL